MYEISLEKTIQELASWTHGLGLGTWDDKNIHFSLYTFISLPPSISVSLHFAFTRSGRNVYKVGHINHIVPALCPTE